MRSDIQCWQGRRIIPEKREREECERVLRRHYPAIKKIFVAQAARSSFPCISWLKYQEMCEECEIIDKDLNIEVLDQIFMDTSIDLEEMPEEPSTELQRFQFMEVIVRLAGAKYLKRGICSSYAASVRKLLDEHILRIEGQDRWQEFRDQELWQHDVDDLFKANSEHLTQIYQIYLHRGVNRDVSQDSLAGGQSRAGSRGSVASTVCSAMTFKVARDFMLTDNGLSLTPKDVVLLRDE